MNDGAIFSFIFEYGTASMIIELMVLVGWFAYDEIQTASNRVVRN